MIDLADLVDLIDRFGEDIEWDLHERLGLDLLDWFRGVHPWPKLLRLVPKLPAWSRYRRAVEDDDDIAALRASNGVVAKTKPSLAQWSQYDDLKATIMDEFTALRRAVSAPYVKGNLPSPKWATRPETAADRAARLAERATHASIVAKVLPRG